MTEADGSEHDSAPRERKRLGSVAKLVLLTRPPVFEHSSIEEFKRWKAAFDELVAVHDAQLDEIEGLRDTLGDARDALQQCVDAGERGHQYDVGELRATVEAIDQELG